MSDIRDKIKKLLALAGNNPNENEAKAALLRAKKLMVDNKIRQSELEDAKEQNLVYKVVRDIAWTTDSGRMWYNDVCNLLAENHFCVAAWMIPPRTRTHYLHLTGMEGDIQVCEEAIRYTIRFMDSQIKRLCRRKLQESMALRRGYNRRDQITIEKWYAQGFVNGLKELFAEQVEQNREEWGLVLVKASEPLEKFKETLESKSVKVSRTYGYDSSAYTKGHEDGKNLNLQNKLGSVEKACTV